MEGRYTERRARSGGKVKDSNLRINTFSSANLFADGGTVTFRAIVLCQEQYMYVLFLARWPCKFRAR